MARGRSRSVSDDKGKVGSLPPKSVLTSEDAVTEKSINSPKGDGSSRRTARRLFPASMLMTHGGHRSRA